MRLVKLSANKPTFKTVSFNDTGLSLIVASQRNPGAADRGDTTNAVGKSLIVALLHFCLGSREIKEFGRKLPGWVFTLTFKVGERTHHASRSTDSQATIALDGAPMKRAEFTEWLGEVLFSVPDGLGVLTFRALLPFFLRPRKTSYARALAPEPAMVKPWERSACVAFLLGLDVSLAMEKAHHFDELEDAEEQRRRVAKEKFFRDYFGPQKDPIAEMEELDRKLSGLEQSLSTYQVAPDFYDRQQEANRLTVELQTMRNQQVALQNALADVQKSLSLKPEVNPKSLYRVYEEARVALGDAVKKRIEEVTAFHRDLIRKRDERLHDQRRRIEQSILSSEKSIEEVGRKRDALLSFLGTHGALDEFVALTEQASELRERANRIRAYQELLAKYERAASHSREMLASTVDRATTHLQEMAAALRAADAEFQALVHQIYPGKAAALTVQVDASQGRNLYQIDARIDDDTSDAVRAVEVFCFDLVVVGGRRHHDVHFVFHDSRLFASPEPRQRAAMLALALDLSQSKGFQYIATVSEDQLAGFAGILNADTVKALKAAQVLSLTDGGADQKLLGVEIPDLRYEVD